MPRSKVANREVKERQRANLLAAARRLIVRGQTPITMEALAGEAGVSQGLAYRYFPSKDALFRAVMEDMLRTTEAWAVPPDVLALPPRARIERMVVAMLERRQANPEFFRFFFRSLSDGSLPSDLRARAQDRVRVLRERLRDLVVAAQAAGEITAGDPDELVVAMVACIEGLWRQMSRDARGGRPSVLPRPEIVLRLLGPTPTTSSPARATRPGAPRAGAA